MAYILLIIGFILLVKGADWFVSGSSAIAEHFHIPGFIIGLTIVACGTSLPEAAISVAAAVQGANGIVVGNALGSNMMNLLVVLGASALIRPCTIERSVLRFEYPLSILAAALLLVLSVGGGSFPPETAGADSQVLSNTADPGSSLLFSRIDGIILLTVFVLFLYATVRKAKREREIIGKKGEVENVWGELTGEPSGGPSGGPPLMRSIAVSLIGAGCIIVGGDLVVDAATAIASGLGIDETLIGLTVVAFGTSLPELVTSMVAAFKRKTDIAVGNVIGSNLFNLLFVLGLSTAIHPIEASMFAIYDLIILIVASLIVLIPLARKQTLTRGWGAAMLGLYGTYLAYIIGRTM